MYPGTAKFQTRPASPSQFGNFSPTNGDFTVDFTGHHHHNNHNHSMSMRHPKTITSQAVNNSKMRSASSGAAHHMVNSNTMGLMGAASTLGHHRGDLIYPDEMDSIEFCMPPPPAPSNSNSNGHSNDMLLVHAGNNGMCESSAFTERRRRGHGRRSNHKMDVEQQVCISC